MHSCMCVFLDTNTHRHEQCMVSVPFAQSYSLLSGDADAEYWLNYSVAAVTEIKKQWL